MRKVSFAIGEYYHVFNRGTDKRCIADDDYDRQRFLQGMSEFNTTDPIGSIYEHSFVKRKKLGSLASKLEREQDQEPLVHFIAFCLIPNHYHFILQQVGERGIEKFMQRFGTGYTKYYNNRHERTGSLFQGTFKALRIDSNEYLLHLSAYVNLNFRVHQLQLGSLASKFVSSWDEYIEQPNGVALKQYRNFFCKKEVVLEQFKNESAYGTFAERSVQDTLLKRGILDESSLLEGE